MVWSGTVLQDLVDRIINGLQRADAILDALAHLVPLFN